MKFLGKYGEYQVLVNLLANEIEAYPAIKINQDSYDFTAVILATRVVRIQVKSTALHNKSTNNQIGDLDREYDYLILVVIEDKNCRFFVLPKEDALRIKGSSKHLATSHIAGGVSKVRPELIKYESGWGAIR